MPEVSLKLLTREAVPLSVQARTTRGKGPMGRLRREQACVPGIIYGHGKEPVPFQIEARLLERTFSKNGHSVLFVVDFEGGTGTQEHAIVRELQHHKVTGIVLHLDLLRIDPNEKRVLTVPINAIGVPHGVSVGGGAVQHSVTTLDLECVISEMPSAMEIDITAFEIGDGIHVSDLLEQEPRIVTDADVAIVSVLAPRLTVDDEVEAAAAAAAAEAAEEGLEGEEGEEGEEGAEGEEEGAEGEGDGEGEAQK
jgi:large subunit ribosomal protein L25